MATDSKLYSRTPSDLPTEAEVSTAVVGGPEIAPSASDGGLRGSDGNYEDARLVARARAIYSQSTDYLRTNIEQDWEVALSHFNNEHAPGGRMYEAQRGQRVRNRQVSRGKVFRPKTRASIKQHEAGLATAMFGTTNLVNVAPQNPSSEEQQVAAGIARELLQYRLGKLRWELTAQGAFQDTKVYGLCVSHQYWSRRVQEKWMPVSNPETGEAEIDDQGRPLGMRKSDVIEDTLRCDLIPPENLRFDPGADWRNVADTSSYLILIKPMRVIDVENMMRRNGGHWLDHDRAALVATKGQGQDGENIRYSRDGDSRTDPQSNISVSGLVMVNAHMNILREEGKDIVFWTLGTSLLLTRPRKLTDMEPWLQPGERPVVVGVSSLHSHRNYPDGDVGQIAGLQEEINIVANQRIDNVRLALNKRFFAKRSANINVADLVRNRPGSVVLTDNPREDILEVTTQDVTGSSYREQDALATELDELAGGLDMAKVATDGASPGGIARAGAAASAVRDYGVWLFVVSWVEPVLRQLLRLEQTYEEDETILAIAADRAGHFARFKEGRVDDELLEQELFLRVDASLGTLDPLRKVERLRVGLESVMSLPEMGERIKPMQVSQEIFGALGFSAAERFFLSDEEYEEIKANAPPPPPSDTEVKMRELDIRDNDNQMRNEREQLKAQIDLMKQQAELDRRERIAMEDRLIKMEIAQLQAGVNLSTSDTKNQTERDTKAAELAARRNEINQRREEERQNAFQSSEEIAS